MKERLQSWIGRRVQVACALDTACGTLVSADDAKLTIRLDNVSGYEHGQHVIYQLRLISYVRLEQIDR